VPDALVSSEFDAPIPLPKDAAAYVQKLPKATQQRRESQIAVHCLIDVAEGRDFIMHARIGVLQALNRNKPQAIVEQRKAAKKYRIVR